MSQNERDRVLDIFLRGPSIKIKNLGDFYDLQDRVSGVNSQSKYLIDNKTDKKIFPIEKIILEGNYEIGGKNREAIEKTLKQNRIKFSPAEAMLCSLFWYDNTLEKPPQKLHLVDVRVRDFGFTRFPTTKELYKTAEIFNFFSPPQSVIEIPELYTSLSNNQHRYPATKPMEVYTDYLTIFELVRDDKGELCLRQDSTRPSGYWDLDDEVIFVHAEKRPSYTTFRDPLF